MKISPQINSSFMFSKMKIAGLNKDIVSKKENNNPENSKVDEKTSRMLSELRDMRERLEKQKQAQEANKIAEKLARGEFVTEEEKEYLRSIDPKKYDDAHIAKQHKKMVEEQMKNANSKEEAAMAYSQGLMVANKVMKKDFPKGEMMTKALWSIDKEDIEKQRKKRQEYGATMDFASIGKKDLFDAIDMKKGNIIDKKI